MLWNGLNRTPKMGISISGFKLWLLMLVGWLVSQLITSFKINIYSFLLTMFSQVQIWRRSFDILPPPMREDHKYYAEIVNNPSFSSIQDKVPQVESLKTTMLRVIPFWSSAIVPDIKNGKRVLVVCHGTSLRGIVKHIDRKLNVSCYLLCCISQPG